MVIVNDDCKLVKNGHLTTLTSTTTDSCPGYKQTIGKVTFAGCLAKTEAPAVAMSNK